VCEREREREREREFVGGEGDFTLKFEKVEKNQRRGTLTCSLNRPTPHNISRLLVYDLCERKNCTLNNKR
jgi:hypothetical protein